jgi:hypothetical protein
LRVVGTAAGSSDIFWVACCIAGVAVGGLSSDKRGWMVVNRMRVTERRYHLRGHWAGCAGSGDFVEEEEMIMGEVEAGKTYPLEEALRAQKALRSMAGLGPEQFPIQAFVGMISDEIEALRNQGRSDEEIAQAISQNSKIAISGTEIRENYASPEERHAEHHG